MIYNFKTVIFKDRITSILVITTVATLIALLTGCAPGVFIGGTPRTYTERDSVILETPRPDILDIATEVGKSIGLNPQSQSREMLMLSNSGVGSSMATGLTGFVNMVTMTISLVENQQKLDIQTQVTTNKGHAREKAERFSNEFKSKLLEKLKPQR